jgi:hypothetical protein
LCHGVNIVLKNCIIIVSLLNALYHIIAHHHSACYLSGA